MLLIIKYSSWFWWRTFAIELRMMSCQSKGQESSRMLASSLPELIQNKNTGSNVFMQHVGEHTVEPQNLNLFPGLSAMLARDKVSYMHVTYCARKESLISLNDETPLILCVFRSSISIWTLLWNRNYALIPEEGFARRLRGNAEFRRCLRLGKSIIKEL